jgi:hypothetical protein
MAKKQQSKGLVGGVLSMGIDLLNVSSEIISGTAKAISIAAGHTLEVKHIVQILDDMKISSTQYTTEKHIEGIVSKHIDEYESCFVQRQFNIGGHLGLKIDIDVSESVGIEIKLAKELSSSTNIERLLGQVLYYSKRKYKSKIVVLVVGTSKENDRKMEELEEIVQSIGATFYYKNVSVSKK